MITDKNEELMVECFRLTFTHEYKVNGERKKIDLPITVECVMPLGEMFGVPRYSKRDIVMMLSKKLTADMRGDE